MGSKNIDNTTYMSKQEFICALQRRYDTHISVADWAKKWGLSRCINCSYCRFVDHPGLPEDSLRCVKDSRIGKQCRYNVVYPLGCPSNCTLITPEMRKQARLERAKELIVTKTEAIQKLTADIEKLKIEIHDLEEELKNA